MRPPTVFPRLMGEEVAEVGLDLHELAALVAFHGLLSKFGERYSGPPTSLGMDQLSEQAWMAADAFLDARRDPRPRPTGRDEQEKGGAE